MKKGQRSVLALLTTFSLIAQLGSSLFARPVFASKNQEPEVLSQANEHRPVFPDIPSFPTIPPIPSLTIESPGSTPEVTPTPSPEPEEEEETSGEILPVTDGEISFSDPDIAPLEILFDPCCSTCCPTVTPTPTPTPTTPVEESTITVTKLIDADGDLGTPGDQTPAEGWEFTIDGTSYLTDTNGQTPVVNITPDSYNVSETLLPNYSLLSASCLGATGNGSLDGTTISGIQVGVEETVSCTFINTPGFIETGSIAGTKFNDLNNDSVFGEEPGLPDWVIKLFEADGEGDYDPNSPIATTQTDVNGQYLFSGLNFGQYVVCEELENGWQQTYPQTQDGCYLIDLNSDRSIVSGQDFGNFQEQGEEEKIELELEKENSVSGSTVTYTLSLHNKSNVKAFDVSLRDQLPFGFTYQTGTSQIDGTPVSDPSISGQLLIWDLGDFDPDQTKVVTYKATIGSLPDGIYPNVAIACGYNLEIDDPAAQKDCTDFVYSVVGISSGVSTSAGIGGMILGVSAKAEPQVLGAGTGSETFWLILAILMIISGFLLKRIKFQSKFWGVKLATLLFFFLASVNRVSAVESLFVRLTELPEYKRTDNFKVYYNALEQEGRSVNVTCSVKKDGSFDWKTFGGNQTDPTGFCEVFGNELTGDGSYQFKAVAQSSEGSTESNWVQTIIDRIAPNGPSDYQKSRESQTSYKIHWKNPGETDYGWTRIFASTSQNFTADDATKKADVGGSPSQEFDYVVSNLEPDKEYYFALQGFDKAGNASGLTGDGGTTTFVEEKVESAGTGGGSMDGWGEGQFVPNGKSTEEKGEEGSILGGESTKEAAPARVGSLIRRYWWFLLGGLILGVYLYYRRSSTKK